MLALDCQWVDLPSRRGAGTHVHHKHLISCSAEVVPLRDPREDELLKLSMVGSCGQVGASQVPCGALSCW